MIYSKCIDLIWCMAILKHSIMLNFHTLAKELMLLKIVFNVPSQVTTLLKPNFSYGRELIYFLAPKEIF